MKIYSKFQDYYDSALGSFWESDVNVNRVNNMKKIAYNDIPVINGFDGRWKYKNNNIYGDQLIKMIGFCGKWYFYIYNEDHQISYKTIKEIEENNSKTWGWLSTNESYTDPETIPFWNEEIFVKFVPVIRLETYNPPSKWIKNPNREFLQIEEWPTLKDYDFQKIKDPYTALWEIEHWLDSHAIPDNAVIPVGDDITRLQAYGFDRKTSFRKPKEN